jgi:ketosteroid isomerase-like protein
MKSQLKVLGLTFLFGITAHQIYAQVATEIHKDSLSAIVTKYYDLNFKIFQSNSTIEDIDNVFELFTEDFTYVHPKYGGTYSRDNLYNGYVRNQKNGGYNGSVIEIEILNKIVGLNAVVTQKRFIRKKTDEEKEVNSDMTLFEFRDGKISRIFEYW